MHFDADPSTRESDASPCNAGVFYSQLALSPSLFLAHRSTSAPRRACVLSDSTKDISINRLSRARASGRVSLVPFCIVHILSSLEEERKAERTGESGRATDWNVYSKGWLRNGVPLRFITRAVMKYTFLGGQMNSKTNFR